MAASIFLGSIAGDAADLASNIAVKSYSRSQEFEADTLGVRYLSRNGYDLTAVPKFLSKLRANSKLEAKRRKSDPLKIDSFDIFATHPRTLDRVKRAINNKESEIKNNVIQTDFDHRIAMSFCVMGTKLGPLNIKDSISINTSFPTFKNELNKLGGNIF